MRFGRSAIIDNLSEEARKGQREKAEQGIWPTKTPLGYLNLTGPDGRKVIAVYPEVAPIVSMPSELYATGEFALKDVAKKARAAGLAYEKAARRFPPAPCIRSCAIACTLVGSSGTASSIRASTIHWSGSRHESGCRA